MWKGRLHNAWRVRTDARTASLSDIPASCIVRIAAKLDLTGDILALRASCTHARMSLGLAEWAILISQKCLEPPQRTLTLQEYALPDT